VAAAKPDLIYVDTYYPEGGLIAKAMYDAKTPAKCLADYGAYDNGFIAAAGLAAARNCPVVGVPAPRDFPAPRRFSRLRPLYPSAPTAGRRTRTTPSTSWPTAATTARGLPPSH
jgi:ABC-type branched-subunit amino acid transport system substrate-binding protein